jgi:hypothetical protein
MIIEASPRTRRALNTWGFWAREKPYTLKMMRAIAYTPNTLMKAPESSADTGAGAEG